MNRKARAILNKHNFTWNEFDSDHFAFKDLPAEFVESIDEELSIYGLKRGTVDCKYSVAIDDGFYQVQGHDVTVDEHTDEVANREFFALIPFSLTKLSKYCAVNHYGNPVLKHTSVRGSTTESRLQVGRLVVFNPQEEHSLTYYGDAVKLMLFTVIRK